jgi:hypothetical protein
VLQALYAATGGEQWEEKTGWMSDDPLSQWEGVTINTSGRVTRLELTSNNLRGTTLLSCLHHLMNAGNIPHELSQLSSLRVLYLSDNNLSG